MIFKSFIKFNSTPIFAKTFTHGKEIFCSELDFVFCISCRLFCFLFFTSCKLYHCHLAVYLLLPGKGIGFDLINLTFYNKPGTMYRVLFFIPPSRKSFQ